jgi:hypothetical protein
MYGRQISMQTDGWTLSPFITRIWPALSSRTAVHLSARTFVLHVASATDPLMNYGKWIQQRQKYYLASDTFISAAEFVCFRLQKLLERRRE